MHFNLPRSLLIVFLHLPLTTAAQEPCASFGADVLQYIKHPSPVLSAGVESWEAGGVLHIAVCDVDGVFYMFYTGLAKPGYAHRSIGLATSTDGINWVRQAKRAVLSTGQKGDFDDVHVHMPTVVYDSENNQFRMWYVGYENNRGNTIGYAESPDGLSWTKKGQVLSYGPANAFDSGSLREPTVIYDTRTRLYKLWYNGTLPNQHYGPTGYAISEDGVNWGRVAAINGDQERFIGLHVVQVGACYHGWYGTGPEIGYASSADGLHWKWPEPEVVVEPGDPFDSRYVQAPVVLVDQRAKKIRLWYNGAEGAEETLSVGYAEAFFE